MKRINSVSIIVTNADHQVTMNIENTFGEQTCICLNVTTGGKSDNNSLLQAVRGKQRDED